jgi:hypothetical protein
MIAMVEWFLFTDHMPSSFNVLIQIANGGVETPESLWAMPQDTM